MSTRLANRIFLILTVVALMLIPLLSTTLRAQQNQEQTPYYDPRYENLNQEQPPTTQQNRELPATAGESPLLGLVGVFFLTGAAGLRLATRA